MTTLDPYIAVEANDAEKRVRDELCHPEWGAQLSVSQFMAREAQLRATPFARRSLRTWLILLTVWTIGTILCIAQFALIGWLIIRVL